MQRLWNGRIHGALGSVVGTLKALDSVPGLFGCCALQVPAKFFVNSSLKGLVFEEIRQLSASKGFGGFLPAVKQIANVAALPGIVGHSLAMPDMHSGYGFAIGNVAAFDMDDPRAVVSPGGVGFDINCGVRLLRTNLFERDVVPVQEELAQRLFDHIPVGVGSKGIIPTTEADLEAALEMGLDWSLREGYAWAEDKEHCFAPDTEVLMADGRRRAIGECCVGDVLVDDAGAATTIKRTSRGCGRLFSVAYANGPVTDASPRFVCNALHQLVVFVTNVVEVTTLGRVTGGIPMVAGYRVTHHSLAHDDSLSFPVPVARAADFVTADWPSRADSTHPSLSAARESAWAFAQAVSPLLLWEPMVEQYLQFASAHPDIVRLCHMMRAAPDRMPRPSPFLSFSALVKEVSARADAHWLAPGRTLEDDGYALGNALGTDDAEATGLEHDGAVSRLAASIANGREAAEQAVLCAPVVVRAAFLAGMIDARGRQAGAGWVVSQGAMVRTALLVHRVALSLGFHSAMEQGGKAVAITAPTGAGDIVSPRLLRLEKRVPPQSTGGEVSCTRWPRGAQLHRFAVTPAGSGAFVSVEVEGGSHRILLADYLIAHNCEEYGRMLSADPAKVSRRAKKRGLPQLGTLGAGNHYAEIQVVEDIYDKVAAGRMGLEAKGQVVVMIHSGSRGLGHQVATDALTVMEGAMARDGISTNDRQLACARISSTEGQDYLAGMAAAANYAFVNRASMAFLARQAFAKQFGSTPDDLDMATIYDVSHNIAKEEEHLVDGRPRRLLVHRKGATRAFGPHHPLIPVDYQLTGQPVLIGGSMGTCSYVLTGTEKGMAETFGSTCHGAGRAASRAKSRRVLDYEQVLGSLKRKGISIRVASPKLVMEEAPESYKDVSAVVDTCHAAGISNKVVKLRPIAVVKG